MLIEKELSFPIKIGNKTNASLLINFFSSTGQCNKQEKDVKGIQMRRKN